jgi:hypothetical protein
MHIGQHARGRLREILGELGKRPSALERKARTAERHRLQLPTRLAVIISIVGLGYCLLWAIGPVF